MRVTFLGTSGAVPTTARNPCAISVQREGDRFLFDCGEGTQRQMMRFGTGFDIEHIFVTHIHGDHVLGIPGLLQTLDFNERDIPLAIHGPSGTRSALEELAFVIGGRPDFPVRINQVNPGEVAVARKNYEIKAVGVDHRTTAVGYAIVEEDRKGRFNREMAEKELGIPPGPKYSTLHAGKPVEHAGRTIQPEEVVGPSRPGRTVVYTGDTRPCESIIEAADGADLLVHDGTFSREHADRARKTGHSTAIEAGEIANQADAKRLAITHISSRYSGDDSALREQVNHTFEGEKSFVADDGLAIDVPYPDVTEDARIEDIGQ